MNADMFQQEENFGRRWARALLDIGEPPMAVKFAAAGRQGPYIQKLPLYHSSGKSWRKRAREVADIDLGQCQDFLFMAGVYLECDGFQNETTNP